MTDDTQREIAFALSGLQPETNVVVDYQYVPKDAYVFSLIKNGQSSSFYNTWLSDVDGLKLVKREEYHP